MSVNNVYPMGMYPMQQPYGVNPSVTGFNPQFYADTVQRDINLAQAKLAVEKLKEIMDSPDTAPEQKAVLLPMYNNACVQLAALKQQANVG